MIETFWSRDVTDIRALAILSSKDFYTISKLYVLSCFKYFLIYILGQNVSKNQTREMVKRTISSLYVLNCFKYFLMYIFLQSVPKIKQEKFWTISSICAKMF